jgi:hypothetical protein
VVSSPWGSEDWRLLHSFTEAMEAVGAALPGDLLVLEDIEVVGQFSLETSVLFLQRPWRPLESSPLRLSSRSYKGLESVGAGLPKDLMKLILRSCWIAQQCRYVVIHEDLKTLGNLSLKGTVRPDWI